MSTQFPVFDGLPAPNKSCGPCSLCCKVYDVPWLDKPKPEGKWCHHCSPGRGCAIWLKRPSGCADFHCLWRLDPQMGPEWRPDVAKFIMNQASTGLPFAIMVDPAHPEAFRREPYYSKLKAAAAAMLERQVSVIVFAGAKRFVMLPDGDQPIPEDRSERHVEYLYALRPDGGKTWKAEFPMAKAA